MNTMTCEGCWEPIGFPESRTSTGNTWWHTHCFNQAEAARREYAAEREDCEGFTYRPLPDELPMSETGAARSEVFPSMATAAASLRHGLLAKSWSFHPTFPSPWH